MERRSFGSSGLVVPILGFGGGHIGGDELSESEVETLLGEAVDAGVTFIDTARSYGASEERIGRHLQHRRHELVLSTKGGYGIAGVPDWSALAVSRGIEEALRRLRAEILDVYHLHSCPVDVLAREDVRRALDDARAAGKIRIAAYSGENEALDVAVRAGSFAAVQCSVNVCDQRALARIVPEASARGIGVIGKRPLANVSWRHAQRPTGQYGEVYWDRLRAMELSTYGEDPVETALRFAAFAPGVSVVIAGTARVEHLRNNIAAIAKGPLQPPVVGQIVASFAAHDRQWVGQV
jgi:aryl-alcohol dehydrogenase-like predicted oxidoreductase